MVRVSDSPEFATDLNVSEGFSLESISLACPTYGVSDVLVDNEFVSPSPIVNRPYFYGCRLRVVSTQPNDVDESRCEFARHQRRDERFH